MKEENKNIIKKNNDLLYEKYKLEHYDSLATDNLSFEEWKETLEEETIYYSKTDKDGNFIFSKVPF